MFIPVAILLIIRSIEWQEPREIVGKVCGAPPSLAILGDSLFMGYQGSPLEMSVSEDGWTWSDPKWDFLHWDAFKILSTPSASPQNLNWAEVGRLDLRR